VLEEDAEGQVKRGDDRRRREKMVLMRDQRVNIIAGICEAKMGSSGKRGIFEVEKKGTPEVAPPLRKKTRRSWGHTISGPRYKTSCAKRKDRTQK